MFCQTGIFRIHAAIAVAIVLIAGAPRQSANAGAVPEGLPSSSRPWSLADYPRAAEILASLSNSELPRSTNPAAASLIRRLTSADVLGFCADPAQPLPDRMENCLNVGDASQTIYWRYFVAFLADPSFADDMMRVMGFTLQYAEVMAGLANEFRATIPLSDPTYAIRMDGLQRARHGFAQIVQGSAITLLAPERFSEPLRADFAAHLAEAFRTISPDLSEVDRASILPLLRQIAASDKNPDVRSGLSEAMSGN